MTHRLIINLGNTHIRFGVFPLSSGRDHPTSSITSPTIALPLLHRHPGQPPLAIGEVLRAYEETILPVLSRYRFSQAWMTSVVPNRNHDLKSKIEETLRCRVRQIEHDDLPTIPYSPPRGMGIDRLLKILAAKRFYLDERIIIFDFGTALTVDVVDYRNTEDTASSNDHNYLGGMILPGFTLSLSSLHTHTEQLPQLTPAPSPQFLSHSTEGCITGGIFHFYLQALEGIIKKIKADCFRGEENFRLLITGGDAQYFKDPLSITFKTVEVIEEFNLIATHLAADLLTEDLPIHV